MRTYPSRRRSLVRAAAVAALGLTLLVSCVPQPEPPTEAPDPVDSRRDPGRRWERDRTTTTTRPTTTTQAPTTVPTTPPTTPTPPSGTPTPNGPTGNWTLKFADEFEGSSLDLNKWRPNWFGANDRSITQPINDYEESCYDPDQVRVANGMLHLTAERLSSPRQGCIKKDGSRADYVSGMVMSLYDYNFTYGYIEARINLPGRNGVSENWAAFWANGRNWPRSGEIDVMETLGGEPRWHFHYADERGAHRSGGSGYDLISPKTGWHTFGALWEPGRITFYYDGRPVGTQTTGVTSEPMYLILNHAVSNHISGPIRVPSTLQVDYVCHWQRS